MPIAKRNQYEFTCVCVCACIQLLDPFAVCLQTALRTYAVAHATIEAAEATTGRFTSTNCIIKGAKQGYNHTCISQKTRVYFWDLQLQSEGKVLARGKGASVTANEGHNPSMCLWSVLHFGDYLPRLCCFYFQLYFFFLLSTFPVRHYAFLLLLLLHCLGINTMQIPFFVAVAAFPHSLFSHFGAV